VLMLKIIAITWLKIQHRLLPLACRITTVIIALHAACIVQSQLNYLLLTLSLAKEKTFAGPQRTI
jgi:hypothetical protein